MSDYPLAKANPAQPQQHDATEDDFTRAGREFFETATIDFTAAGFRLIRDLVETMPGKPRERWVTRYFLGDGGATIGLASVRSTSEPFRLLQWIGLARRRIRMIRCQSQVSDDTFITTDNTAGVGRPLIDPAIDGVHLHRRTAADAIVAGHRVHVRNVLAGKPHTVLVRFDGFDQVQASLDGLSLIAAAAAHLARAKKP